MSSQVLHLIDHLGMGGAQRIVSDITRPGEDILYALRSAEDTMNTEDQKVQIANSSSRYNLRCFLDIYKIVSHSNFNVVHCHLTKSKIAGLFVSLIPGTDFDLVFHEHGKIMRNDRFYKLFLNLSGRYVDRHIAVSREICRLLEKTGVSSKEIDVIYNFADREKFSPEKIRKFELGNELEDSSLDLENDFVVGFAGRIIEMKGWRTLVSAAKKLNKNTGVVIAGSGSEVEVLKREISDLEKVVYTGYVKEIRKLLGSVDCFVLPSHWDPSPMMLYEVQSSGVPLICSNVVSINELIEDRENGVLFESKNSSELSDAIVELKEDPELRENLRDSGLKFGKTHSLENYRRKLEKAYEQAANNREDTE